jgi:hypothetical protein
MSVAPWHIRWHNQAMARNPSKTTYEVVPRDNSTFGVRVSNGESAPTLIPGFHSEVEAHKWILEKRRGNLRRLMDKLDEMRKRAGRAAK